MNIQGTLFETENPQLPIHGVMCSCLFPDDSPKALFYIEQVDYKTATKIMLLPNKLKELREQCELPQRKVAAALDIDTATYCKIEWL